MTRGKAKKIGNNSVESVEDVEKQSGLATKLTLAESEPTELAKTNSLENMADINTVLQEIREFRRENGESLKDIQEDIKKINSRVDEAERRIMESEERIQNVEDATLELLELQTQIAAKLMDQEGRLRRDNIRIHGVKEGAEDGSQSMIAFIETLLREKLELPPAFELTIERAHRSVTAPPPKDAPPRSIVVKFLSYRCKESIIKTAWQKKGFEYEGQKIIIDHDYAPEILKQRKKYTEAKKVLRLNKIRFQTPFPARLRVFYEGETRMYNSAEEATKDMAYRGYEVAVVKPAEDVTERIKRLTWRRDGAADGGRKANARQGYKQRLQAFRRTEDTND